MRSCPCDSRSELIVLNYHATADRHHCAEPFGQLPTTTRAARTRHCPPHAHPPLQRTPRDHRALSWLGTTSPFNITAEAILLGPFTLPEVAELLAQHTADTGQRFEPVAVRRIWELAQGHPWLTNALADQIINRDVQDRSLPILAMHVDAAKDTLILERRSHIESLVARLREPRVRRILEPMLAGTRLPSDLLDDDLSYVLGLGLVRAEHGELQIANPIYREVIPRALTWTQQISIHEPTEWYVRADGSLDLPKLMSAWQAFWRKDDHLAAEGFGYREAGPHLMLMAFLQRVVNGGGRVKREYGLGRGALDLMIFWKPSDTPSRSRSAATPRPRPTPSIRSFAISTAPASPKAGW